MSAPPIVRQSQSSLRARAGRDAFTQRRTLTKLDLPIRFRADDEEEDDGDDGVGDVDNPMVAQSVYGMMAATQTQASFSPSFQQDSASDGEIEDKSGGRSTMSKSMASVGRRTIARDGRAVHVSTLDRVQRRQKSSEGRREHSLPKQVESSFDEHRYEAAMTKSQFLTRSSNEPQPEQQHREVPVLDRKLQAMAKAEVVTASDKTNASGKSATILNSATGKIDPISRPLPQVIADIFSFPEPEEVVAEYPCWYLQNVLLEGYMYITQKHICFYAYLKKKTNVVVRTGQLGKQGRHSFQYRRYYFVLKGDSFSYYNDASDPYFPRGVLDLRYAISADQTVEQGAATADFTITTSDRVYLYRADSAPVAKSWVKQLQKIIFRNHNEGDSVKISLPIQSVDDIERMPMIDFAETIKLRIVDNDETFAVDEFFFTFFGEHGSDALELLQSMTRGKHRNEGSAMGESDTSLGRSTILPSRGKTSIKQGREHSHSPSSMVGRQSSRVSTSRLHSGERKTSDVTKIEQNQGRSQAKSQSPRESSESLANSSGYDQSSDSESEISPAMSASQMLTGDGVFGAPTLRVPHSTRGKPGQVLRPTSSNVRGQRASQTSTDRTRPERPASRNSSDQDVRQPSLEATALGRGKMAAISVANAVRSSGKRMGSYLSSSPTGYINKLTEAVIGESRHYNAAGALSPNDSVHSLDAHSDVAERQRRFQEHFALPRAEYLEATYFCYLHKNIPLYGKIYISGRRFCFRSLIYGVRTKLVIPFREIVNIQAQRGFRLGYSGLVLVIHGHEELFFEFGKEDARNDCAGTIFHKLENSSTVAESVVLSEQQKLDAESAAAENELLQAARKHLGASTTSGATAVDENDALPILFDDPGASLSNAKSPPPMLVTCLTIGSRGDVQPYIALCKGLMVQGHRARIATHAEFREWVESHGIEFAEVAGDPAELMRVCVENGMFTIPFFLEANSRFRSWLDGLLLTAWKACQGSDLIIESPSAMCGIHIAEALEVPYFRAFTMPWTRTRAYPHAFAVRNAKMGGAYNYMTYTLFDNVFWTWTEGQINSWRAKTLKLQPTNLDKLQQNKVPFLYNFSPSVVPPPLDFSEWVKVTGYWFLDEGAEWQPPRDLADFINKARNDDMKLVYIGFGSVTVSDSRKLTEQIINAVVKADVRCVLSKGWSDRFDKQDSEVAELDLPACILEIRSAPHDWLFKQMDAVVHHGGAGTTGASLRAGKPTIIKPFFGDQYFFATRVEDLGVGIHLTKATEQQLGKALWTATHDHRMQTKARLLGESIRAQDGVHSAINAIYSDLAYAKSLIKRRQRHSGTEQSEREGGDDLGADENDLPEDTEENWTFVEKDANDDDDELMNELTGTSVTKGLERPQQRRSMSNKLRLGPMILGRR